MIKLILGLVVALSMVGISSLGHAAPRKAPGISYDKETGERVEPIDPQSDSANPNDPNYDDSLLIVDHTEERDSGCDSYLLN